MNYKADNMFCQTDRHWTSWKLLQFRSNGWHCWEVWGECRFTVRKRNNLTTSVTLLDELPSITTIVFSNKRQWCYASSLWFLPPACKTSYQLEQLYRLSNLHEDLKQNISFLGLINIYDFATLKHIFNNRHMCSTDIFKYTISTALR